MREGWNGYNILHNAASRVAGLDMGFLPGEEGRNTQSILSGAENGDIKTVYLLGADEIDTSKLSKAFVIYQGSHGDAGAHCADVILPGAAYTEKSGLYVNMEGRVQLGMPAVPPKGEAKEDWAIIRALSAHVERVLPYDSLEALRETLFAEHPSFASLDNVETTEDGGVDMSQLGAAGTLSSAPLKNAVEDFYLTNPIARASQVMAECSELAQSSVKEAAE